ncbi:Protein of unknown function [Candidatus Pantoea symbiotica]|jgi:hypothetical protein|uniref:YdgH/BhsA/McbA-like domain-containing protein n=1 Tax=Candidatus Pantoea symbiotica TaxID=1884370 RepID=A0A1I3YWQ6_9GAMM|nr:MULTISPECIES: DUF1471 family periplasmic protein YahO [Pantoea]KAJ9430551.1 DUF1471 family periplasmic protein YahO [Pantoea sp. YR343]MRT26898.1 DUF1471 domain-containing protein [Enterobacteriaceae bacterium RIT697]SFK35641.1 Protein of unknown function [Pantoea symbiotica]SFU87552.1 Protein of unknown function [Pantoea sp. YR525]
MKKLMLGLVVSALSFSSFAAQLMTKVEFEKVKDQYVEVGNISTSGEMDAASAKEELSKMADEKGGDIYIVTSANTNNKIYGTAIVYKKK